MQDKPTSNETTNWHPMSEAPATGVILAQIPGYSQPIFVDVEAGSFYDANGMPVVPTAWRHYGDEDVL